MKRGNGKPYIDIDLHLLNPTERAVLRTYYDTDLSWEQVADALCYSVSRVYQIRRTALARMNSTDSGEKRL